MNDIKDIEIFIHNLGIAKEKINEMKSKQKSLVVNPFIVAEELRTYLFAIHHLMTDFENEFRADRDRIAHGEL